MNPESSSSGGISTGIHSGTFTPDSRYIVVPYRTKVAIIDIATHQRAAAIDAKGLCIQFLSFTPDGRYLMLVNSSGISVYAPT